MEQRGYNVEAPENCSLIHSISADFAMCSGLNMKFNLKAGQTNELLKQNKHHGNVAVLKDHKRFVYNLVTKERQHERCTYIALFYALVATRDHMVCSCDAILKFYFIFNDLIMFVILNNF